MAVSLPWFSSSVFVLLQGETHSQLTGCLSSSLLQQGKVFSYLVSATGVDGTAFTTNIHIPGFDFYYCT